MKYTAILCLSLFMSTAYASNEEQNLLPENYKVYYIENVGVLNHNAPGAIEKKLPTMNEFKGTPGCYIACYSHSETNSVYPVSKNTYVMGQIRVPGKYHQRICIPAGYEDKDISAATEFNSLCAKHLPLACPGSICWAGGDTGGWFGIQ